MEEPENGMCLRHGRIPFFAWCFGCIHGKGVVLVEVYIAKRGILCYNLLDKVALLCPDEEK